MGLESFWRKLRQTLATAAKQVQVHPSCPCVVCGHSLCSHDGISVIAFVGEDGLQNYTVTVKPTATGECVCGCTAYVVRDNFQQWTKP